VSDGDFLSRWSRRKHEARRQELVEAKAPPAATPPVPPKSPPESAAAPVPTEPAEPAPLPAIESLTPESDFTPFMRPDVEPGLRQQALKTLFQDARYNVMDGLDVYIDDYTKADPLPEGWLEKMEAVARLGVYRPPLEADTDEAAEVEAGDVATAAEAPALDADAELGPEVLNTVPDEAPAEPLRTEPQEGGP
jgi:hypothetical protein